MYFHTGVAVNRSWFITIDFVNKFEIKDFEILSNTYNNNLQYNIWEIVPTCAQIY